MEEPDYKYDLALSFLAEDESLATQLSDLLQDRFEIFLYSRKQEQLAGTDGEITFNSVFGSEARFVAVLYREGWGQTPWTRIEETAIRNRAFEEGYDFVIFIPVDTSPSVPKWLPKTQLYVGLNRWGIQGAASVLEDRINQRGGTPKVEGVGERAKRLERSRQFDEERKAFFNGPGVQQGDKEFETLSQALEENVEIINRAASNISLVAKKANRQIVILERRISMNIQWRPRFINSLEEAKLEVSIWRGHAPFPNVIPIEQPERLNLTTYKFDLIHPGVAGWKSGGAQARDFSTLELAESILKTLMDKIDSTHGK